MIRCRCVLLAVCLLGAGRLAAAQPGLQVTFGPRGLEKLNYAGLTLEDTGAVPADAFHIWHMKATDLRGQPLTGGQYTWGENCSERRWDPGSHTWTYRYPWGMISTHFQQTGDALDIVVTTTNLPDSGIVFEGASVYPLALHFPSLPAGFGQPDYPQLAYNTTGPSVTVADFGRGKVVAVSPDAQRPLYTGFLPADHNSAYTALLSSTVPEGLAVFQPHNDRPIRPGQTDQYRLSLRFASAVIPTTSLATDAYANWAKAYPATLRWSDRRAIGTAFLASSPSGDSHHAGGYPNNPRRFFNDANPEDFNIKTPAGLLAFQRRVLRQAETDVTNLKHLNAQGAITWDIEGEQFPQDTSYVCAPDQVAQLAPEMESVITDRSSPFAGRKLDDAYFGILRSAGFRVGVCIRPQHFTLAADGTAQQTILPTDKVAAELERKIRFAHDRWGATLFYIDSSVDAQGGVLPAAIFREVAAAFPDSLLIPEESTPLFYAYTAPFKSFVFHGATGTDADVSAVYPHAFSAVLINNVAPDKLAAAEPQLRSHVERGDVLMGQVDYAEPNNTVIASMYAHSHSTAHARTLTTPEPATSGHGGP